MAALPLPPPLPRRDRRGGGGAVAAGFGKSYRGSGVVAVGFGKNHRGSGSGSFSAAMDISAGWHLNHQDLSPRYVSVLAGFTAAIGTTAGIISPIVAGLLTKDQVCTLIT